ncbi:hypothetical protein A1O3_06845 [Capronia epimyces CBS 606.96]|uniref:Uncharacterized protein n=1 Tax=Capronia epimyces CBS 606.96 TaxID=1182542 RepID=W9XS27_9EURO|nr:uncharacterized protein A1O3_06845 [Capronia epimyces CBS 606.96]EXJ83028.1 hypothetical protein A1O3_06845 [Capronia epimyces CBS 606.96]
MASTPPAQITSSPGTPDTPLHGAAYDRENHRALRLATRSSTRIASRKLGSTPRSQRRSPGAELPVTTPRPSHKSSSETASGLHSPQLTPKNKAPRRVQFISPSSPDQHTSKSKQHDLSSTHLQPLSSSSTTLSEPMLPTPVKTPQKKMPPKVGGAARALFQDNTRDVPASADLESSPRRSRRTRRYNGYSLESFSAEDDSGRGQIQIFTDSRDKVPQVDKSASNPFVAHTLDAGASSARKLAGTAKRRKISGQNKRDAQVDDAIRNDEGMVYVFRGKKVYRRFDDGEDVEEEIDSDDLGFLDLTSNQSSMKPMKTLTRRSIRPTRLFQTEEQKRAREVEKEEEALTDIEGKDDSDGELASDSRDSSLQTARLLRSTKKTNPVASDEAYLSAAGVRQTKRVKPASPFDSWRRVKSGMRMAGTTTKSRKRAADEVEPGSAVSKKWKA